MLDFIGGVAMPVIAFLSWRAIVRAGTDEPLVRRRLGFGIMAWFLVAATLAALGAFRIERLGTLVIGLSLMIPVVAGIVLTRTSPAFRARVLAIPIAILIALHVGRLLGAFFLVLHSEGRLPPTFAHAAGWGDIAVGVLAIPVAVAAYRRTSGWPALVLAWNAFGFVDLITAVTLGVGSADSPLRFIDETPASSAVGTLPWALIPTFLVPMYLLTHLAIFAQLKRAWSSSAAAQPARA